MKSSTIAKAKYAAISDSVRFGQREHCFQKLRLTCDQNDKFECREFADEDGIEAHSDQRDTCRHESCMPPQDTHIPADEYDQALDLQGCCI